MFAIILNAVAIFIGSALGALFQRGISEKYVNVLNTAMGLCAITLGMNVAIESMQKTQYPVLFIILSHKHIRRTRRKDMYRSR